MTEEEIEKQADDYVIKTVCKAVCPVCKIHSGCTIPRNDCNYTSNKLKGYIDGAKWGIEHAIEWHDLREDPNNLPKEKGTYWVYCYSLGFEKFCYMEVPYILRWGTLDKVIAWCELPQFKE